MAKIKLVILIIFLAFIAGAYASSKISSITGQTITIDKERTLTKAVCSKNKECIDIKITCKNSEVTNLELVSELKKFSPEWNNPRTNLTGICD